MTRLSRVVVRRGCGLATTVVSSDGSKLDDHAVARLRRALAPIEAEPLPREPPDVPLGSDLMDPVEALKRIAFLLERSQAPTYRGRCIPSRRQDSLRARTRRIGTPGQATSGFAP